MYAVIQTGGKQVRVEEGKTVTVEKLPGEVGTKVVFDQVLLVSSGDGGSVTVGKPLVAGAKVTGEIVEQTRGDKLIVNVLGNDTLVLTRRPERWTDRFSGKMGDVWGDHEDNMRYLDEERASWSERFPALDADGN